MRHVPLGTLLALTLCLAACGGGGTGETGGTLALTPSTSEITEGFEIRLAASPSNPGDQRITWRTSDARIAVVDPTGLVHGCSPGQAVITATGATTGAEAEAVIRVVADSAFNTTLPSDASNLEPTFERESTLTTCDVTLRIAGVAAHVRKALDRRYHALELPQASMLGIEGAPALPYHTLHFAVPIDADTGEPAGHQVQVSYEDPTSHPGIRPWPHQPPQWIGGPEGDDRESQDFFIDEARYGEQTRFPDLPHTDRMVRMGNPWILEVRVFPVRYHAGAQRLELSRITRVHVEFSGTGDLAIPRVIGDYSSRGERGAEQWIADLVQNAPRIRPVTSNDLVQQLLPIDDIYIQDDPFDLLIITRTEFSKPARELARWRQDHGTRVWLAVLSAATYPDAASIKEYILTMDDLNRLECSGGQRPYAMAAILLFGDVEWIPTCQGMNYRARPDPATLGDTEMTVGTDHLYTTLRGYGDHHPDVAIGRISVDSEEEGDYVVKKIQAYESYADPLRPHSMAAYGLFDDVPAARGAISGTVTFTSGSDIVTGSGTSFIGQVFVDDLVRPDDGAAPKDGAWAGNVVSVDSNTQLRLDTAWTSPTRPGATLQVAFQDGQDNWEFVKAAERVRQWMLGEGVGVRFGYERRRYYAVEPTRGFHGGSLPADLLAYDWQPSRAEIVEDWQSGEDGIILHSDHGHPEGWGHPYFRSRHLENIDIPASPSEPTWYPLVFNINCDSGFFDTETYTRRFYDPATGVVGTYDGSDARLPPSDWPPHDECFCEALLRHRYGGGVAAVGAARGSDADKNDKLIDGLFGALYADYTEGCIPDGPGTRYAYERLGDVVRAAKFRMYIWTSSPPELGGLGSAAQAEYNMQIYHLFGDPMLRVRPPAPGGATDG